jgi:hypothetical protein
MNSIYIHRVAEGNSVHQTELDSITGTSPSLAEVREEGRKRRKVQCNLLCTDFANWEFRVRACVKRRHLSCVPNIISCDYDIFF